MRLFLDILAISAPILVMGALAYLMVGGESRSRELSAAIFRFAIKSGFARRRDFEEIRSAGHDYARWLVVVILLLFASLAILSLLLSVQTVILTRMPDRSSDTTVQQLLSKLPTAELLTRQHEETLKALDHSLQVPTSSSFSVGGTWAFISLGLVGFLLLLVSMLRRNTFASNVGAVTGALMITASTGLTLFKSTGPLLQVDMKNDLQFKRGLEPTDAQHLLLTIDVGAGGTIPDCGDSKRHDQAIYPFADGDASLTPAMRAQISAIRNSLTTRRGQGKLVGLLLIGSADRRGLVGSSAHRYGSNATLAQVRARAVLDALDGPGGLWTDHPRVVTQLDTGAQIVGTKDRISMAPDRSVLICALWN